MDEPVTRSYGSWESPVSAEIVARAGVGLGAPIHEDGVVWFLESRPSEGGRTVVVRRNARGERGDVTPPDWNVRSAVHEYGGGAYTVAGGVVYFVNWSDQRVYRQVPGDQPRPLVEKPPAPRSVRYADLFVTPDRRFLLAVRETHAAKGEAVNDLVAIPLDGGEPIPLAAGRDFYAAPRVSPDGRRIAWLEWDHPDMPWDAAELFLADFDAGTGRSANPRPVAGGPNEAAFQPSFSPDGRLHFVSDRTGWWNLYVLEPTGDVCLHPAGHDSGEPHWNFGAATYRFLADGRIVLKQIRDGRDHLLLIDRTGRPIREIGTDLVAVSAIAAGGDRVYVVGATADAPARLLLLDDSGTATTIAESSAVRIDPDFVSAAEPIRFPTGDGEEAYGFFYPPRNPRFAGPRAERPPLVVVSHGGPTSATSAAFSLSVQYFTTRGIAVADVNYRGSTGYGRAYRRALNGRWGIADREDCENAALFLAERGDVDPKRLAIRGGSAGGYTTLCALTFSDVFAAGVSRYGVADLEALARDTHKFESRYLDRLVGPWPKAAEVYRERSPIHHVDRLTCPLLVMQGLEDAVVPPAQSTAIVAALEQKGIPCAYLAFPGEQHGFRRAETIQRALEAELWFYGRIFGFAPADAIEPLTISGI